MTTRMIEGQPQKTGEKPAQRKKMPTAPAKMKTRVRPEMLAYGRAAKLNEVEEQTPLRGGRPTALEIHVRDASYFDSDAIAAANVAAWTSAYRGVMPETVLKEFTLERFETRWEEVFLNPPDAGVITLVAEDDHYGVLGYIRAGPAGEEVGERPCSHEVYAVNVAPRFKRLGAGRALLRAGLMRLMNDGAESCFTWVLQANPPARFFMKAQAASPIGRGGEKVGPITFPKVAYGWSDLGALFIDAPPAPPAPVRRRRRARY